MTDPLPLPPRMSYGQMRMALHDVAPDLHAASAWLPGRLDGIYRLATNTVPIDRIQQSGVQYGRTVKRIDRWYPSSQIRSQCGRRDGRKPLDIREWECPQCGIRLDRDWNAALNILDAAGLAESLNARGGDVRRRLAQTGRNADAREAGTRRTARLH